ncbi:hypothetical protein Ac2012v2_003680 [Leucoagaricus gongylophorus]
MSYDQISDEFAGPIGLLKHQLFNNLDLNSGPLAKKLKVEHLVELTHLEDAVLVCRIQWIITTTQVSPQFDAILAGAEVVLGNLGVRQAIKRMPKEVHAERKFDLCRKPSM